MADGSKGADDGANDGLADGTNDSFPDGADDGSSDVMEDGVAEGETGAEFQSDLYGYANRRCDGIADRNIDMLHQFAIHVRVRVRFR